jgi:hypothetical protein
VISLGALTVGTVSWVQQNRSVIDSRLSRQRHLAGRERVDPRYRLSDDLLDLWQQLGMGAA